MTNSLPEPMHIEVKNWKFPSDNQKFRLTPKMFCSVIVRIEMNQHDFPYYANFTKKCDRYRMKTRSCSMSLHVTRRRLVNSSNSLTIAVALPPNKTLTCHMLKTSLYIFKNKKNSYVCICGYSCAWMYDSCVITDNL